MVKFYYNDKLNLIDLNYGKIDDKDIVKFLIRKRCTNFYYCTHYKGRIKNIPKFITQIHFSNFFNQPLISRNGKRKLIHCNIKRIAFGETFDQPIDVLDDTVREIFMENRYYSQKIKKLPNQLEILMIRCNKNLNHLPKTLKYLDFTLFPNQGVNNIRKLCNLVKLSITLENEMNFLHFLPPNLKELCVIFEYENNLFNFSTLPKSIRKISLLGQFNSIIENVTSTLEEIFINSDYFNNKMILKNSNVKSIFIENPYYNRDICEFLPNTLEELAISHTETFEYGLDNLPKNLKRLYFIHNGSYDLPLDNLPNLEDLELVISNSNKFMDFLPHSLKRLKIRVSNEVDFCNLPNVRKLCIEVDYPLDNIKNIPISVDTIILDNLVIDIKKEMIVLPSNLKALFLGFQMNEGKICIGTHFTKKIIDLPESLEYLFLKDSYEFINEVIERFPKLKIITDWDIIDELNFWNLNDFFSQ